jgi:hypothetical protein
MELVTDEIHGRAAKAIGGSSSNAKARTKPARQGSLPCFPTLLE